MTNNHKAKGTQQSVQATLEQQQQWLFRQILQGRPDADSSQWITGSQTFPVKERLRVYQTGYRLRLLECMQVEFPALLLYLGDDVFQMFALGYLQQMPSRHYSLYELGAHFADFLRQTRPTPEQANVTGQMAHYLVLPEQLAQLERAQAISIRAQGQEDLVSGGLGFQLMTWPNISLPDTSQLIDADFDLLSYLQQAESYLAQQDNPNEENCAGGELTKPDKPAIEPQALLVFRERYRVNIVRLEAWQSTVIKASLATDEINWPAIASQCEIPEYELLMRLNLWLPEAIRLNQVKVR